MNTKLLEKLLAVVDVEPLGAYAEIAGQDPIFPLPWRIGEAGAATIVAGGVAAAKLWQLRTGRMQRIRVEVDAAAAAMRGDRYLRREAPSSDTALSPAGVPGAIQLRSTSPCSGTEGADATTEVGQAAGRAISRPILGGLHHEYEWEAA